MPRANRHYLPGLIWHITHRCHDRQFLLKFSPDRLNWLGWLRKARERHGLCVLDYSVTCNHVHLLALDNGDRDCIPASMQLAAGSTAQNYNTRRGRRGAFWEDRYHATAVETGTHLLRCMAYIDLNMVRAGAAAGPADWRDCGYREIQGLKQRGQLIDVKALARLVAGGDERELRRMHGELVQSTLLGETPGRVDYWSSSVAVGSPQFIRRVHAMLDERAEGREPLGLPGVSVLREPSAYYGPEPLRGATEGEWYLPGDNTFTWRTVAGSGGSGQLS